MKEVGGIAEVVSIVGFSGGLLVGLVWLVMRVARGRWVSAPAEIVDGELRWLSRDGTVQKLDLGGHAPEGTAELEIHYRAHRPDEPYFEAVAHDEKGLRLVTLVLLAVGVVGFVASMVLQLVG